MAKELKITLKNSVIGCNKKQKEIVKSLGLTRRGRSKVMPDIPSTRGAINKVSHLLEWEEVQ